MNDAERIAAQNKAELEEKIVRARAGLEKAADYLRSKHGIADQRAKDQALDTFDKMGKSLSEMEATANAMGNARTNPLQAQRSRQITAERNQPGRQ